MSTKKILLIDDEQDILEILSYNLEKEGYEVVTASSGEEGIEIARKLVPDLILLDVMMPGQDGIETCQELRQIKSLQKSLIVFLSARSEEFSQLAGYQAGGNDYIVKIIKPKVLISKVNALLQLTSHVSEKAKLIEVGDLVIDRDNFKVSRNGQAFLRSEEHTSELQSRENLVCRHLLEKKKENNTNCHHDNWKHAGFNTNC